MTTQDPAGPPLREFIVGLSVWVILLTMSSCTRSPRPPAYRRAPAVFFYNRYPAPSEDRGRDLLDSIVKNYQDPADGLFRDYRKDGNFGHRMGDAFGPPFDFQVTGWMKTSMFNAWVGMALLKASLGAGREADRQRVLHLAESLRRTYWSAEAASYDLVGDRKYYDAINDAMVGAFLMAVGQYVQPEPYRAWGLEGMEAVVRRIGKDGRLSCCEIEGRSFGEMHSRHGLVPAALAYAYRLTGEPRFAKGAVAVADVFLKDFRAGSFFTNWMCIGTDSEIGLGLLEVYLLTGDRRYLDPVHELIGYYDNPHAAVDHDDTDHGETRHTQHIHSVVCQAEHIILLRNLAAVEPHGPYARLADERSRRLGGCFDKANGLYPHMCYSGQRHDTTFYSPLNALIYLSLPAGG